MRLRAALLWGSAALVALACVAPPLALVSQALRGGDAGSILSQRTLWLVVRSVGLALSVAGSATVLGVGLAWLTTRYALPLRGLFVVVFTTPLAIPSYVGAYLFLGSLGEWGWFGSDVPALRPLQSGFPAAWFLLTLLSFPYVFLPVRAALAGLSPALEEAAQSLGLGARQRFFRVVLPQLVPAASGGALLVALYTLSDFGAVALLQCRTFTFAIYSQYESAGDRSHAARTALMLVVVALLFVAADQLLRPRHEYHVRRAAAPPRVARTPLGRAKLPVFALAAGIAFAAVGAPVIVLLGWLARGGFDRAHVTESFELALTSMGLSGAAAIVGALVTLPVAFVAVRRAGVWATVIERAAYVGFALPGIVLALALVSLAVNYARPLYQSVPLLVAAYVVHFLPQSLGASRASLLQIDPQLEEAGRSLGAGPLGVFGRVTLPLLRPGLVAGALLVFLTTMKELPATLILGPTGTRTLATSVFTWSEEAFFARASVPALFLLVFAGVPMLVLLLVMRREGVRV